MRIDGRDTAATTHLAHCHEQRHRHGFIHNRSAMGMWVDSHEYCRGTSRSFSGNCAHSRLARYAYKPRKPFHYPQVPSVRLTPLDDSSRLLMLFHRNQSMQALVVAASVAGLGVPITTTGTTPSRRTSLSGSIYHHFHSEQYQQYRKVCYRLAFMAKTLRETAGVFGALGSPVKLTCGIALSLVEALEVSS